MGMKYVFNGAEQRVLGIALIIAGKAARAAEKACNDAYLTQGIHEAQELGGYVNEGERILARSEEADAIPDGTFELSRGAVAALKTGLGLYMHHLSKAEQTDTKLLLGTEDHDTRRNDAQKLIIRLSGDLWSQDEPVKGNAGARDRKPKGEPVEVVDATVVTEEVSDAPRIAAGETVRSLSIVKDAPRQIGDGMTDEERKAEKLRQKREHDAKVKRDKRKALREGSAPAEPMESPEGADSE